MTLLPFAMFATLLLGACGGDQQAARQGAPSGPLAVETFVVRPETLDQALTTHGNILPNEEVVLAAETAGTVTGLYFEEGGRVRKGQLLVQIDDSELRPALQKLQAQLKTARDEHDRKKQLLAVEGISREDFEAIELKVTALEADIGLTEARIRKSRIIAPFDGTVGLRNVSPGAFVAVGDAIARLVQTDPVKIEFTVPEPAAPLVRRGMAIAFTRAGSSTQYPARVYATDPAIDPGSRSLRVRATAANAGGALLPGAYAELTVTLDRIDSGLLVPALAVIQDIRGGKVFVIRNGAAATRYVHTGLHQGDFVQVTEGIAAGDTVITTSLLSMHDGQPVVARTVESRSARP